MTGNQHGRADLGVAGGGEQQVREHREMLLAGRAARANRRIVEERARAEVWGDDT